jgi:hypothetical protein
MKLSTFVFIFICSFSFSQNEIKTILTDTFDIKVNSITGVDYYGTLYFISENNTFNKKVNNSVINYSNIQLSNITTADSFNPLKISLFYRDLNTFIILDNRLAEIYKIDFNRTQPYKNATHISSGFDNTVWLFNIDSQQLELYDYRLDVTKFSTVPLPSIAIDLKSNYNFCWLLTEDFLYKYNYFGSMISKIKNDGFTEICIDNGNVILKKDQSLYYLKKNSEEIVSIKLPKLLINQFLLTNETLYIYDKEILHQFQLKTE